jgi:toxin ParE1/3/4
MQTSKFQIRFLSIAEEDFAEIISYISADNTIASEVVADKIKHDLALLSENSIPGRIPADEDMKKLGYRYSIILNYLVFYTIDGKTILIHRIFHGAQNYRALL